MGLKLITAPANDPANLEEAKAHLNVTFSDDDDLIEAMIAAATKHAEHFTGRAFIDQTWDFYLDAFPSGDTIEIPQPPLIEVGGVFYLDGNGDEQEFASSNYAVDDVSSPGRLRLSTSASWPTIKDTLNAVRIRFRCGYLDLGNSPPSDNVPEDIKKAILMEVGTLYMQRETVVVGQTAVTLPSAWEWLLRGSNRVERGMA